MRKIMLSAFAIMAIVALSSFSTATGPSSTPNVTANINIPDYNGYEAISANTADCLAAFYAATDAMFDYAASEPGSEGREAAFARWMAYNAVLMICIMQ